jgi:hypothetical protein
MNNLVCQTISHDLDINKRKEVADCEALEFDLYFQQKYPQSERVDYIEIIENGLILKESIKISRNEIQSNLIDIIFYIVVKNDTDIVFLNNFLNIQQIKNNFHLYKTRSICKKLSIFNTRLCQE